MVSRLHYPPRSRKCPQTSRRRQFFGSKFRIIKSRLFTVSQVRHSLIFFLPSYFCWKMERISTWQHWHFHIIFFLFRTARGFMHMKIQKRNQAFILGQFSKPFNAIADMLLYYSRNSLPVKGAEHISLKKPVCEQLLWLVMSLLLKIQCCQLNLRFCQEIDIVK